MPLNTIENEISINKITEGSQNNPAIATYDDGSFVVAWTGEDTGATRPDLRNTRDVYVRRFDANGNPIGNDILIEQKEVGDFGTDREPAIATTPDGGFIVVQRIAPQLDLANQPKFPFVFGHRYDAANQLQNAFFVDTPRDGLTNAPDIAVHSDGSFVVTWSKHILNEDGIFDGLDIDVFFQRFDANANKVGAITPVNAHTLGRQNGAAIAMDGDGSFVITWGGQGSLEEFGDRDGIFARHFNADGTPVTDKEFLVNQPNDLREFIPAIDIDNAGHYVISWNRINSQEDGGNNIFARQFDANGQPLTDEFQVHTAPDGAQTQSNVALAADGRFVITWTHENNDDNDDNIDVFARSFKADGTPDGGDVPVNTFVTGPQFSPAIAMDKNGNPVIVWSSQGQDGEGLDIFAQRFELDIIDDDPVVPDPGNIPGDISGDIPGDIPDNVNPDNRLILGTNRKDRLTGTNADETLVGMNGNDRIRAKGGDDVIIGINPDSRRPGRRERDKLIGNGGDDLFVLGDERKVFYDDGRRKNAGLKDYALIKGFNKRQDTIQLHGKARDYVLGSSPKGKGVGLFLEGKEDELIAVIRGNTNNLRLNSNAFEFV